MRNAAAAVMASLLVVSAVSARADPHNQLPINDNSVSVTQTQAIKLAFANGGNVSTINQVGSNNFAETDQIGSSNYADIGQFGNFNYAKIVQDAVGAVAIYNQIGNANSVTVTQTGVDPPPVVVTQHR